MLYSLIVLLPTRTLADEVWLSLDRHVSVPRPVTTTYNVTRVTVSPPLPVIDRSVRRHTLLGRDESSRYLVTQCDVTQHNAMLRHDVVRTAKKRRVTQTCIGYLATNMQAIQSRVD